MVIKIGDVHGEWNWFPPFFASKPEGTIFIQVGDFGIGYNPTKDEDYLKKFNELLKSKDQVMYVIRGNHDNPAFFKGNHILSHIKLVPDYHTEVLEGKKYLFIGGATSIDRKYQIEGVSWWPDEVFVPDMQKIADLTDINVVISHTAPNVAHPFIMGGIVYQFAAGDPELLGDLNRERMLVTAVYQELCRNNPGLIEWWYGHFHWSKTTYVGSVKFRLLNINEAAE
jgi:UDP-2,3-diacylglucosamine pyrophosphatase LpxH